MQVPTQKSVFSVLLHAGATSHPLEKRAKLLKHKKSFVGRVNFFQQQHQQRQKIWQLQLYQFLLLNWVAVYQKQSNRAFACVARCYVLPLWFVSDLFP